MRVVRVGTHAVSKGSKTTLWNRLSAHRGSSLGMFPGGGKHRTSVFRRHIGDALLERDEWLDELQTTWGIGGTAPQAVLKTEHALELQVSIIIRRMPILWLEIDDKPGRENLRRFIEKNLIALLSNAEKESIDSSSGEWLGQNSPTTAVRESGLWNVDNIYDSYESNFLDNLELLIHRVDHKDQEQMVDGSRHIDENCSSNSNLDIITDAWPNLNSSIQREILSIIDRSQRSVQGRIGIQRRLSRDILISLRISSFSCNSFHSWFLLCGLNIL